jgi:hypothetical protein
MTCVVRSKETFFRLRQDVRESRLEPVNTCLGRGTLSGTPDPAEAGTPDQ